MVQLSFLSLTTMLLGLLLAVCLGIVGILIRRIKHMRLQLSKLQLSLETLTTQQHQTDTENTQHIMALAESKLKNEQLMQQLETHKAFTIEQKEHWQTQHHALKTEFQQLAQQILDEKTRRFDQTSLSSIESLLKPFREQVEGFQKRVNDVHSESLKSQTALSTEINKIAQVGIQLSDDAQHLTSALKGNKKTLGNWGEIQLENALELAGLQPDIHYQAQAHFKDASGKHQYPDFVVKLPDEKHMVIDSKVSLNSYQQAIQADQEVDIQLALDAHVKAVQQHIDSLAEKSYNQLPGINSPSFVLMFMPIEAAYIEALKHRRDIFQYGYQKNVILVSHTTLMPILRTVANLWMLEQSHRETKAISDKAGDIYNQVCLLAERLNKMGAGIQSLSQHYNQTVKALCGQQGLHGKVSRFRQLSTKVNKQLPNLEAIHPEIDREKLAALEEPS